MPLRCVTLDLFLENHVRQERNSRAPFVPSVFTFFLIVFVLVPGLYIPPFYVPDFAPDRISAVRYEIEDYDWDGKLGRWRIGATIPVADPVGDKSVVERPIHYGGAQEAGTFPRLQYLLVWVCQRHDAPKPTKMSVILAAERPEPKASISRRGA